MTVTKDDFNKIWASTSSVPTYTFSDTDYQNGWEFVGNLPPTRAMWDEIQRKNDEKMQLLYTNASFFVDSVADLRTADAEVGTVYATKGYYTANDGGNGCYIIRADASDTDDGGSIIILNNGNVAELITDGTVNLRQFGAKGDNTTNDSPAIQSAVDYCIQHGKSLYVPTGTYLIYSGDGGAIKLGVAVDSSDYNHVTANGQGITIFGDGENSVFKEADGRTELNGKYTKMFYCYLGSSANNLELGAFHFKDLTFDKNARSNADPSTPYGYEQAHIISWAGSGVTSIDSIVFEDCFFKDKAGGGVNMSSSPTLIKECSISKCIFGWYSHAGSNTWGARGDIEVGMHCDMFVVDSVNANYMQAEPTLASSVTLQRHVMVTNSAIDTIEMTAQKYDFLYVANVKCYKKFLVRGYQSYVTNSVLMVKETFFCHYMNITNSKILLPYDADANSITSMVLTLHTTAGSRYPVKFCISNCDFVIDSDDSTITPTGAAITSTNASNYDKDILISNCYFDKRLATSVNWYYCGSKIRVENCVLAGTNRAIVCGTYSTFTSEIEIVNCDFSKVTGDWVYIFQSTANWKLSVQGVCDVTQWKYARTGSSYTTDNILSHPHLIGTTPPTTGLWLQGDVVYNSTPSAGGYLGWICTQTGSGNNAVWKGFGAIES